MQTCKIITFTLGTMLLPFCLEAADSMYCPQNRGYINLGMTQDQVILACGQPSYKKQASNAVTQRVPVTQLIYTTLNRGAVFQGYNPVYQMWSLPSGSTGTSVQVDITNNKISSIKINGSSNNAMSLCGGTGIQLDDDMSAVYSACGAPDLVNHTYIDKPVPSDQKPEVWVYQVNQYQPPFTLTFVNGALQNID